MRDNLWGVPLIGAILKCLALIAIATSAQAQDVTKTLHTPYGSAPTVMDKWDYDKLIDLCLKGSVSAGFLAGRIDREEQTCSDLSDKIIRRNKDQTHMLIAAWYGRQDCDRWQDTDHCILGTLRPMADYQGAFEPIQDVVALAKKYCAGGGVIDGALNPACHAAANYFIKHGEPLLADKILQNVCTWWAASHGGGSCENAGIPEEVAKRNAERERIQAELDAARSATLSTPAARQPPTEYDLADCKQKCLEASNQCGSDSTSRYIQEGPNVCNYEADAEERQRCLNQHSHQAFKELASCSARGIECMNACSDRYAR
jgi:hypothetical protein